MHGYDYDFAARAIHIALDLLALGSFLGVLLLAAGLITGDI